MTDNDERQEIGYAEHPDETLVMDAGSERELLRIKGFVPMPIGSRIQLGSLGGEPQQDGVVTAIRLWGAVAGATPMLRLDVMLRGPEEDVDLP